MIRNNRNALSEDDFIVQCLHFLALVFNPSPPAPSTVTTSTVTTSSSPAPLAAPLPAAHWLPPASSRAPAAPAPVRPPSHAPAPGPLRHHHRSRLTPAASPPPPLPHLPAASPPARLVSVTHGSLWGPCPGSHARVPPGSRVVVRAVVWVVLHLRPPPGPVPWSWGTLHAKGLPIQVHNGSLSTRIVSVE